VQQTLAPTHKFKKPAGFVHMRAIVQAPAVDAVAAYVAMNKPDGRKEWV
jgi:hypothetical protein